MVDLLDLGGIGMDQRNVLLVMSDACGWRELRDTAAAHPRVGDVATTESPREALRLVENRAFDAVICAGRLGGLGAASGMSAVEFVRQLRQKGPAQTRIAVIANEYSVAEFMALSELHLAAHLLWSDLSSEMYSELLYALLLPRVRVLSDAICHAYLTNESMMRARPATPFRITAGEMMVLPGLAAGLTHAQIAASMGRSLRTVERYIRAVKDKFEVESPVAVCCKAYKYGLIDDSVWHDLARDVA